MLNDRNYMNKNKNGFSLNDIDPINCIYTIIAVNVVVHILFKDTSLHNTLALTTDALTGLKVYQFVTYMFLHSRYNMFHLIMNMWGLYLFGKMTAPQLGTKRFLQLYFFSGIFGALLWTVSNLDGNIPAVGASGGVFGVMMAAAMLQPNVRIMLLFPPIPMKLKTFAIVFGLLEVFYTLSHSQPNVANLIHLGGLIGAYICLKYYFKLPIWDMMEFIFGKKKKDTANSSFKPPHGWKMNNYAHDNSRSPSPSGSPRNSSTTDDFDDVSQQELDRILDKISEYGIKSLTAEEMAALKYARNKMKRQ